MSQINIVCPHCFVKNRVPETRLSENPKCGGCHDALFVGRPLPVTGAQFEKMIAGTDIPVIVDFWASWCGPCKMFAPIYAEAATTIEPHFRLLKLDTEANQTIATRYRIASIPTLAIFKGGRETLRQSGVMPLSQFLNWIGQAA